MDSDDPDWWPKVSEHTQAMYRYWAERCRGAAPPRRADIDPVDLPRHFLPWISIVEAVPDERRYVYRLVGTREVDLRGRDPTGKSIVEAFFGGSLAEALGYYDTVVSTGRPLFTPRPYASEDGRYVNEENLFLPLSDDGTTINRILVFSRSLRVG